MSSRHFLFCVKALSNPGGGGAERVLTDVANGLVTRGHVVTVLSYDSNDKEPFYPLDPKVNWIRLGIGSTIKKATTSVTLKRMKILREVVLRTDPDVVIGFMHSMFVPLGVALLGTNIRIVASEHIVPEHYKTRPLERLLLRLTPFFASAITCVSPQVRDLYPKALRRKMIAIPNAVSVNADGYADTVAANRPRKVLLTVGRLEEQKDHATLIKAFKLLTQTFPDWDLKILGEGSLRGNLNRLAEGLGVADRIRIPGASRDVSPEYLEAQLFVLPSRYESFGLTLVEAFAHGLPAVGFDDCPGVNQLIKHGHNGWLVSRGNDPVASLANGLRDLMSDDALRVSLSVNTTDTVAEFELESVLDHWETLLIASHEEVDKPVIGNLDDQ